MQYMRGKINSINDYASDYFGDMDEGLLGKTTLRHLVTHSHGLHQKRMVLFIESLNLGKIGLIEGLMCQ